MKDDLIKRSDAIKQAIEGADEWDGGYNQNREEYIRNAINSIPSADRPQGDYRRGYCDAVQGIADEMVKQGKYIVQDGSQGWIPCSERLPEIGEKVLASTKKTVFTQVYKGIYSDPCRWVWEKNSIKKIVAWMPLPEPWKGADDE